MNPARRGMGLWFLGIGVALLAACAVPPSSIPLAGLPNFHRVNERLYRGAQPDATGVRALAGMGIKSVINLRMSGDLWPEEQESVRASGMNYVNVPLHGVRRPTEEQIAHVLSMIETLPPRVFVHCERGADRTGTVIACYRIAHEGWTGGAALKEAKQHGMALGQFGMKAFISDFAEAHERK